MFKGRKRGERTGREETLSHAWVSTSSIKKFIKDIGAHALGMRGKRTDGGDALTALILPTYPGA